MPYKNSFLNRKGTIISLTKKRSIAFHSQKHFNAGCNDYFTHKNIFNAGCTYFLFRYNTLGRF